LKPFMAAPAGRRNTPAMDSETLREALRQVADPELGHSIVELGLVECIDVQDGSPLQVRVTLVPTSATCPMTDLLVEDARAALQAACPPGSEIEVALDWQTEWTPDRLSPALRTRFGW
jgi:metal-sulfur cluster biosynthetic enzyme